MARIARVAAAGAVHRARRHPMDGDPNLLGSGSPRRARPNGENRKSGEGDQGSGAISVMPGLRS
jgi:hypothetical protein